MSTKHIQDDELEKILADLYDKGSQHRTNYDNQETILAEALQALKAREEGIAVRARKNELHLFSEFLRYAKMLDKNAAQRIAEYGTERLDTLTQLQGEATEGE